MDIPDPQRRPHSGRRRRRRRRLVDLDYDKMWGPNAPRSTRIRENCTISIPLERSCRTWIALLSQKICRS